MREEKREEEIRGLAIQEGQINMGKLNSCRMFHLGKNVQGMLDKYRRIGIVQVRDETWDIEHRA
jgi:hypothetical protein